MINVIVSEEEVVAAKQAYEDYLDYLTKMLDTPTTPEMDAEILYNAHYEGLMAAAHVRSERWKPPLKVSNATDTDDSPEPTTA